MLIIKLLSVEIGMHKRGLKLITLIIISIDTENFMHKVIVLR